MAGVDIDPEILKIARKVIKPDMYHYLDSTRSKPLTVELYVGSVLETYQEIKD